ncbi:unnamed protein product, partial [marine sediment metagenome]
TEWPDQGDIGSCVGQDGAINMEVQYTLLQAISEKYITYIEEDLSAGWLYHWSRHYANVPDYMEGSTNLGLMKALLKKGAASEATAPTDNVSPWDPPAITLEAEASAALHKISSYWNINPNPNDIKATIFNRGPGGQPTTIISAYKVFMSYKDAYIDGIVPVPQPGERFLGGHSSALIGWCVIDGKEYWINFNSWGTDVGGGDDVLGTDYGIDKGLFFIPFDYGAFFNNDFWLIY